MKSNNMQSINNKKKLGRGISALLGNNLSEKVIKSSATGNVRDIVKSVTIENIVAGIYQPRSFFDVEKLKNLSQSIKENGVIQPIVVRRTDYNKDFYEVIAGERRLRASKIAGLEEVPAIIKDISNNKALEFAIIENVQRDDLSSIEEAKGYKQLLDEFGYTQEKVANKLGKSRSYIANLVRLLTLPEEVQKMIQEGLISSSHARTLVGNKNALELAQEIVQKNLSVRDVEALEDSFDPNNKTTELLVDEEDLEQRALKKEYLKTLEKSLSRMIGDLKVKAKYNIKKSTGKITIFYNDFEEIESVIAKLEK